MSDKSYDLRAGERALILRALRLYAKDQLAVFADATKRKDKLEARVAQECMKASDRLADRLLKDPAPDRHALLEAIYNDLALKRMLSVDTARALQGYLDGEREKKEQRK